MTTPFLFGLIGIAGAILMAAGDILLLGTPAGALAYYRRDLARGSMRQVPRWRLYAGSALGVAVAPMQLGGAWLVYLGLQPAGPRFALPVLISFGYTIVTAIGTHAIFPLMGEGLQAQEQVSQASRPVLAAQDRRFVRFWFILLALSGLPLLLGSAWFAYALLTQPTAFPAWVAFANPALLFAAIFLLTLLIPRPLAGYLSPAIYNWMWLLFFVIITFTYQAGP